LLQQPAQSFSYLVLLGALHRAWRCSGSPGSEICFSTVEDAEKEWKSECWHKEEECYPAASQNCKHQPGPLFSVISTSLTSHREATSFQGEAAPMDSALIFIFVIQMHGTHFAQD